VTRVLVVSAEPVGARMAGPAIRALELARALGATLDVTLAAPGPERVDGVAQVQAGLADYDALLAAAARHDVVVAQLLPPRLLTRVARLGPRLAVDLYNPTVVEVLEATRGRPEASRRRLRAIVAAAATAHLAAADFVACASERQRDLWLGGMALRGLVDPEADAADPALRGLIDVVPFGVPAEPPRGPGRLRAALGLPADAKVLVWGGGIWDWLDAPTAIRAMPHLPEDVHLVFLGARRPAMAERDVHAAGAAAVALARELGLEGRRVHFNEGWVPYAERGTWLLDADVGVSAHPAHLETRFAFRTRILDYLWAGLPVVSSTGDALGDRVGREGLGATAAPGDPRAFAAACAAVLADPGPARARVRAAAGALAWGRVAEPLRAFCAEGRARPDSPARARALRRATLAQYGPIAGEALATDGPAFLARKLARNLGRVARRT
jgi:glycosyltransferase involved in cell wall biosynthesis